MSSSETRFCVDCKWSTDVSPSIFRVTYGCGREECGSGIDPVDGKRFYRICSAARAEGAACGPSGMLFESKEKTNG